MGNFISVEVHNVPKRRVSKVWWNGNKTVGVCEAEKRRSLNLWFVFRLI